MIKCDPRPREGSTTGCWLYVIVADIFFFFFPFLRWLFLNFIIDFFLEGRGERESVLGKKDDKNINGGLIMTSKKKNHMFSVSLRRKVGDFGVTLSLSSSSH